MIIAEYAAGFVNTLKSIGEEKLQSRSLLLCNSNSMPPSMKKLKSVVNITLSIMAPFIFRTSKKNKILIN